MMTVDKLYKDAVIVRKGLLEENPDTDLEDATLEAASRVMDSLSIDDILSILTHDQFLFYSSVPYENDNLIQATRLVILDYLEERLWRTM